MELPSPPSTTAANGCWIWEPEVWVLIEVELESPVESGGQWRAENGGQAEVGQDLAHDDQVSDEGDDRQELVALGTSKLATSGNTHPQQLSFVR